MSALELTARLVAGVFLTFANAFFVTTEFALTRLPQFDQSSLREDPGLERAWEIIQTLEIYLTGCQLGITTSSILLGIVAEPAVTVLLEPVVGLLNLSTATTSVVSVVVAVVVINLIHKIWGEQAPTYLGVEKPVVISRYGAPVLYWWTYLSYPFILLGDGLAKRTLGLFGVQISRSWTEGDADSDDGQPVGSRSELKRRMADLLRKQDLPADRRQEIMNALTIGERPIEDIMVPREDVVALSTDRSLDENLQVAAGHVHSRYPLVGGSLDEVVGTIYAAGLLRDWEAVRGGDKSLEDMAADPVRVAATTSISRVIDYLQEQEQELALVEDDEGVVGLVTITDAFEAIAGNAKDPLDDLSPDGARRSPAPPEPQADGAT
jgi:CBS domain containing-hemolysin-like protein